MKTIWKKLLVLPLITALAIGPLRAEPIDSAGTAATNPTTLNAPSSPVPPTTPTPPTPPTPPDPDNVPVSIGPNGIHVGGPSPVDINMPNMGNSAKLFGIVLPIVIVGIVFSFFAFVIGTFLYLRHRRQRLLHETLRSMIEKGVSIPPELLAPGERYAAPRTRSDLRSGLVCIAVGIGLLIFMSDVNGGPKHVGWIPILIGVAFLISWFIEKKNNDKNGGPTIK
jgi:hypothetical protein